MKRTGSILLTVLVCAVVVGYFRGWFTISSHGRNEVSDKVGVTLNVDPGKVKDDAERVKARTAEMGNRVTHNVNTNNK